MLHKPPSPPDAGGYLELQEGLLWARLPIPGPLRHINVWLLASGAGWTLVDTGMKCAGVDEAWERLHAVLPISESLERIIVTHNHPDHFGMAAALQQRHGAPVLMSRRAFAEVDAIMGPRPSEADTNAALSGFAERQGFPAATVERMFHGGGFARIVSGMPADVVTLEARDRLDLAGGGWEVSLHEGHAPGHACLYSADLGTLISGDQVLPTISANVSLYSRNEAEDPLGDYLASLEDLTVLPADTLVLPAHGLPFRTLHARLAGLVAEHRERLAEVIDACATPRSSIEVVTLLFNFERLDPLNRMLAIGETLAHLRYLHLRGRVRAEGSGESLRWHSC
jgi:glyoxylase-like metal-dependent hydrolase (beta-lactamase superfamily II)